MRRRDLIKVIASVTAAWPLAARAQERMRRIGVLSTLAAGDPQDRVRHAAFLQGLQELGWSVGRNVQIDIRWAEGRSERFAALIGELLVLKADVILAMSLPAALAAKKETTTTPVVFIASDPLGSGLVASLARPSENLTGFSLFLGDEFTSKWLELLKEAIPNVSRVAIMWNPTNPIATHHVSILRTAAEKLRLMLHFQAVNAPDQFDGAFAAMAAAQTQVLVVVVDPLTVRYRAQIAELAIKNRLPSVYGFREFADAGGLIAYGVNVAHLCKRAATYVDKIIKGTKPGDLPVEQPTQFELIVNLKTAKTLGLTMPPTLLARANEVIE